MDPLISLTRLKFWVARVFSVWRLVRPSQDGERGERLTNTLFAQAQRRIVRRKLVSVDVRFR